VKDRVYQAYPLSLLTSCSLAYIHTHVIGGCQKSGSMSANNGIIKNAQMRWQRREHNDRMTGYCYIGPDETHEPAQRRDSTISFENVIDGKRTRGSMETPEPSFVKPQRRKSRLSLRSEHKLEETVSSTPRSQSAKSVKLKQNSGRISQSRVSGPTSLFNRPVDSRS
jgi:hypothetical protein